MSSSPTKLWVKFFKYDCKISKWKVKIVHHETDIQVCKLLFLIWGFGIL
jgi:hypothetical protein